MAYFRRRLYRRLRRGFRPSRRLRIKSRSRRSIRKDLDKLGYPTHVKFIGMSQKRTFLLRKNSAVGDLDANGRAIFYLDPRESDDWKDYMGENDKIRYQLFSVKRIYIRITPQNNSYSGTNVIPQFRLTYHNFIPSGPENAGIYILNQSKFKESYVFDATKSVTFVLKNPRPCTGVVADKPRSDILYSYITASTEGKVPPSGESGNQQYYDDESDMDEDVGALASPAFNYGIIFLEGAAGTSFKIQVSYKVTGKN